MTEEISVDTTDLIKQAGETFNKTFTSTTWFGRCIFLSWYCKRGTCKFCFRSTTKHKIKHAKNARRSLASVLVDSIICKNLGWKIEFLTGGYGIFEFNEIVEIAKHVSEVFGEKIWINLGALSRDELVQLKPYVEGVCASIETINPSLHKKICPDKKIQPYTDMLKIARDLGFKTSITIVIGLGETKDDFELLKKYIAGNKLDRITFYALKPVQGTGYSSSPSIDKYAWWIAKTRIEFPKLKIMAGLTPKKIDYTEFILKAGANAITKFPAVRRFGSEKAKEIENSAIRAGREFKGSLTELPSIDWDKDVEKLSVSDDVKALVRVKLKQVINKMI